VKQNFCADAGYKGDPVKNAVKKRGYVPHIKQLREEADEIKTVPGLLRGAGWWSERIPG
jgi:hypothetical protein